MANTSNRRFSMGSSLDEPPNSRLFIIGSKLLTEHDFRSAFDEFGHIEEIWLVKDRQTGENKGVTYIKYSKTSEAAKAMEAMNGKSIGNINRSIRIMIAASREQGSKREANEEEKILRLFVMVPKTMNDIELYNIFRTYGEIENVSIIRDKETRESKGFAYVKFLKFSDAAVAFEQCDRKFKAVFAEPRKSSNNNNSNNRNEDKSHNSNVYDHFKNRSIIPFNPPVPESHNNDGYVKLTAIVSSQINQDQLWKLFDIIPGLDYCQLQYEDQPRPTRGVASIVYTHPQWAAYACEKLHGFEYPPGNRIIVKPDVDGPFNDNRRPLDRSKQSDLLQIAETIAHASSVFQVTGFSSSGMNLQIHQKKDNLISSGSSDAFCSVNLPPPQPLANYDDETVARCFIVCNPQPPPNSVLKDVFCRFGNLIDVYMLNNRNCGYAKYAIRESAESAISVLHGAEINGIRIKVLEAEERPNYNRKRQRIEDKS